MRMVAEYVARENGMTVAYPSNSNALCWCGIIAMALVFGVMCGLAI